jgi:hypothetical protein
LRYTKKFCSDINLLTHNIVAGLPGDYKDQLRLSVGNLMPMGSTLDANQKKSLSECRDKLIKNGECELGDDLSQLLL